MKTTGYRKNGQLRTVDPSELVENLELNLRPISKTDRNALTMTTNKDIAGHKTEAMSQRYNIRMDKYDPPV